MRTEQTFDAMRRMPVEIPPEKVEQFVLAQVAAGTVAVAATTAVKKSAFFFHLNTIVMTTAAAATLTTLAVVFYPGDAPATLATKSSPPPSAQENSIVAPEKEALLAAADTPATKTAQPETKTITHVIVVTGNDTVSNTMTTTHTPADAPKPVVVVQGGNVRVQPNPADYMFTYYQAEPFKPLEEQMEEMERMDELDQTGQLAKMNALEAAEAEMEIAQAEMEAQIAREEAEMEAAHAEATSSCAHDNHLLPLIEEALLADSLITDTKHYTFSFNDRTMLVNGKKQSQEQWEKYKVIITTNTNYRISRRFSYSISKSGEHTSVSINN